MKYSLIFLLFSTLGLAGCNEPEKVPDNTTTFVQKGLFSISLPNNFKDLHDKEGNKLPADFYAYQCDETGCNVHVKVSNTFADTKEKRQEEVDKYIEHVKLMFRAMGNKWSLDEIKKPEQMSDRVECKISGFDPNGSKLYYMTKLIFDKKTYIIQVSSNEWAKADTTLGKAQHNFKILAE